MTKLISFDTSSKSTGYCIYVDGALSRYGRFDQSRIILMTERLEPMVKSILELIETEKPNIVVVETTSVNRNAQTQRFLTMIIGAIYGKCVAEDIFYCGLRPQEWRSMISREPRPKKRDELKEWGKQKVKELYGLEIEIDDISDAILIGRAYINKYSKE